MFATTIQHVTLGWIVGLPLLVSVSTPRRGLRGTFNARVENNKFAGTDRH
jgi:hypothetical protein